MRIKRFNNFITEKLGIVEGLESIANQVLSKLKEKSHYKLEIRLRDKDISVNFFLNENYPNPGSFTITNFNKLEFTIKLKTLNKSTLIHELKHLDRTLAKNIKFGEKNDKWSIMNHVMNFTTNNLDFLLRRKGDAELLSLIIYFTNPDEFESYFHGIYYGLKDKISPSMKREEKIKIINNELKNETIYMFYKYLSKSKFDIRLFFDSTRNLNRFLKEYTRLLNSFHKGKEDNFSISQYILIRLQKSIGKYLKDEKESDKIYQEINKLVNHSIKKNLNKFFRLYTLLT